MANYTKTTDFAAKDTLPGGDTNKVVRGTEFETEFDAISTAIATKSNTADPTFTGTVTIPTVDINAGAIDGTVIGANSAAAGTFTNLTATTADINAGTIDNAVIGGSTAAAGTFTNLVATTADINGGTVDGATIGGSSAGAGTFTNLTIFNLHFVTIADQKRNFIFNKVPRFAGNAILKCNNFHQIRLRVLLNTGSDLAFNARHHVVLYI